MSQGYWQSGAIESPPDLSTLASKGYPTSGNPQTGTPATYPGAAWFYVIDQMRMTMLYAAGMKPSEPPSTTEFLSAVQSFNWAQDNTLKGSVLKAGTIPATALADRSVTAQKLATSIDLKGGGVTLCLKTFTTSELAGVTLAKGELALNSETLSLYVGDGSTKGGHLVGGEVAAEMIQVKTILSQLSNAVAKLGGTTQPFSE